MSSFRPGRIPPGVEVKRPAWPNFSPGLQVAASVQSPARPAAVTPESVGRVTTESDLNESRLEAARILQEAAAEAEQALESARKSGFEQGRQEGIAAGKSELEALRAQAQLELQNARLQADAIRQQAETTAKLIQSEAEREAQSIIATAREDARRIIDDGRFEATKRIDEAQSALVELAVAAAMRLVQGHLAIQPQSIVNMLTVGLRRLKDTHCTVRVSPEDLPLIEAQRSTLERELGAGMLQISSDPTLQRGSWVINSPQGQVDGTLDRQAERIQAALNAALGGKQP